MTLSFSKPTDLPDEVALVRAFIPAGSHALHPEGVPELAGDRPGGGHHHAPGQRYRVIGRLEVNGREMVEVVLLPD